MPTFTDEEQLRIKIAALPECMLRTYLQTKLYHLERPAVWSAADILSSAKNYMQRKMEEGNRFNYRRSWFFERDTLRGSYESYMTYRRDNYQMGQEIAALIALRDQEGLINFLNDNDDIRDRNTGDWVEMLNDGDRFPDGYDVDYCSDCNYIEATDDGSWVYDGDRWVCSSCRDNDYHWSDYHDTVVHNDEEEPDEYDEEEEQAERSIGSYHSSKRKLGYIPTAYADRKTKVFLGLELEMEVVDSNRYEKADHLLAAIGTHIDEFGNQHPYCLTEDDGSLNYGFEMVTGYTGLDVHAKQLAFFKRPWADVKSHDTKTCGLHVHICKKGMTMFHAAKLILFMHDSRNQRLFKTIARRDANRYSQVKNKTGDFSWLKHGRQSGMQRLNEDRYEAVNFQPERTIEFRLFRGTLRYETIMACLEFTYAAWFFTRDTGQQQLTADNFIKFICQPENRKDTANLRSFLRSKGFSLDKNAIVKRNPRITQSEPLQTAEV